MSYYVREPRGVSVDTAALQAAGLAVARAGGPSVAEAVAAAGLPATSPRRSSRAWKSPPRWRPTG